MKLTKVLGILPFAGLLVVSVWGCAEDGKTESIVEPESRGGRGESCRARNDCRAGLACINSVCVQNEFPITAAAKSCDLIECAADADCCDNFNRPEPFCSDQESQCSQGDTFACQNFDQSCRCTQACESERCITFNTCSSDQDCFGGTCDAGRCRATCSSDADCAGDNKCVNSECVQGCTRNEECSFFSSCQAGTCVETGCNSDRECIGVSGNLRSKCVEAECRVPCENDGECGSQQLCEGGTCVFIGCETDEECRHLLGISNEQGDRKAICRE